MYLSTSSSEREETASGLDPAVVILAKCTTMPVLAAVVLVVILCFVAGKLAVNDNRLGAGIEGTIVSEQIKRSNSITGADIIIIGDCSALMGIDAKIMGEETGRSTQSLATLGFVGPRGYAKLLENYFARNKSIDTLFFAVTDDSLKVAENTYSSNVYESLVLDEGNNTGTGLRRRLLHLRDNLYLNFISRFVDMPLPGEYGKQYHFESIFKKTIGDNNGSVVDPTRFQPPVSPVHYVIEMKKPFMDRIPFLRKVIHSGKIKHTYVLIAPVPSSCANSKTVKSQKETLAKLTAALGLPQSQAINTPAYLPDKYFATSSHHNREGKEHFTKILLDEYKKNCKADSFVVDVTKLKREHPYGFKRNCQRS